MAFIIEEEEVDVNRVRIARLQSSLRKFAVVVAGKQLDLTIVTESHHQPFGQPPAWSDASSIGLWHNPDVNVMDVDSLIRLKGLTIHELGHVLFTPRDRTQLVKAIQQRNMWPAFNILEDNRIENMMIGRLSGVAPWLIHAVSAELLDANASHEYLLPLLHGRKYMPKNIRDLAASVYHNQQNVADIQRLIDEYITLNLADKNVQGRALEIVEEFTTLISPHKEITHHNYNICAPSKNGGEDMEGKRSQDDALKRASQAQAAEDAETTDDGAGNGESSDSTNTSSGTDTKSDAQKLDELIDKARSRVQQEILDDIKSMVRGMRSGGGAAGAANDKKVSPAKNTHLMPVSSEHQIAARDFAKALTELKTLYDPGWVSRSSSGRLNAREFLMGSDLDESFDMWDEGQSDVTDIECAVLLDISGSMYNVLNQAYDAMWSIKRALDSINASTTVITFGDYSRVLYDANSRAQVHRKHSWDGAGSTNPIDGIKYARDLLMSSSRAIKLFIIITDGYWSDKSACDSTITHLRHSGVLTGQVYIADDYSVERADDNEIKIDSHNCEVVKVIQNPADITKFARNLVALQQRRILNS
jgi:hypothetical protein